MTRREMILERAAHRLAEALNKETAEMLFNVAVAQAEEELGPPPYMPYGYNRVNLSVNAVRDGVPVEDL